MPKKRKNSKGSELEELKWELRKRGVRPTGSQQAMVIVFTNIFTITKLILLTIQLNVALLFFIKSLHVCVSNTY